MPYGSVLTDVVQSSTANTPPQFNDGSGVQVGTLCRAWVNFGWSGSAITQRAAFNVSSVTRTAAGDYTVNFTTALPDANYAGIAMAGNGSTAANTAAFGPSGVAPTTTAFRFIVTNVTTALTDAAYVNFAAFR